MAADRHCEPLGVKQYEDDEVVNDDDGSGRVYDLGLMHHLQIEITMHHMRMKTLQTHCNAKLLVYTKFKNTQADWACKTISHCTLLARRVCLSFLQGCKKNSSTHMIGMMCLAVTGLCS